MSLYEIREDASATPRVFCAATMSAYLNREALSLARRRLSASPAYLESPGAEWVFAGHPGSGVYARAYAEDKQTGTLIQPGELVPLGGLKGTTGRCDCGYASSVLVYAVRRYEVVVTRHLGLVKYLEEEGLMPPGAKVLSHATPEDVRGRNVLGVLPLHLAALAATVTVVPLEIPAEQRGRELTAEEVRGFAGPAVTYVCSVAGAA